MRGPFDDRQQGASIHQEVHRSLGSWAVKTFWAEEPPAASTDQRERYFYIAGIADTHIIDSMFLQLNCFLGETWNVRSAAYDQGTGSLGEVQLQWVEAQLAEGKPTLVFIHYPVWIVAPTEFKDYGLHPLLRRYRETIKLVIAGHWHKWVDFAHTFGPQHYVMAATRYDQDAYMLLEIDRTTQSCRFVNAKCVDWSTHYSRAYVGLGND